MAEDRAVIPTSWILRGVADSTDLEEGSHLGGSRFEPFLTAGLALVLVLLWTELGSSCNHRGGADLRCDGGAPSDGGTRNGNRTHTDNRSCRRPAVEYKPRRQAVAAERKSASRRWVAHKRRNYKDRTRNHAHSRSHRSRDGGDGGGVTHTHATVLRPTRA